MANAEIDPKIYSPHCAVWEITLVCNLNCIHCGSTAGTKREGELTTEEGLKLVKDLKEINCGGVGIMGGEPLIRKDWYVLSKAVKDEGMKLSIITNGTLVDEKNLERIVELKPDVVGVSIDGAAAETHDKIRGKHNSFEKALNTVYKLREREVPTSIITSLNKLNLYELEGIKDLIVGKDIGWQIQVVTCNGGRFKKDLMLSEDEFYYAGVKIAGFREKYSIDELPVIGAHDFGYHSCFIPGIMNKSEWKGCQSGITNIGIQSNGNIKGCLSMSDEFIEGNIKERSLKEIWYDPKLFKVNRHFDAAYLGGDCKTCEYGESCQGGCSDMSYNLTGKPYSDSFCFHRIEQKKLKGGKKNDKE